MLGVISFTDLPVLLRAFGEGTLVLLFAFLVVAFLLPSNLSTKIFETAEFEQIRMSITMQKIV